MEARIRVRHLEGDRFHVRVGGHALVVDQPDEAGGTDAGPTPTELFAASLAGCVGFYAERFLRRHGLPMAGLAVDADFAMSEDRPARVASIRLSLRLPWGFPSERAEALRAVVEHCTVHNSIRIPPLVEIELDAADRAA